MFPKGPRFEPQKVSDVPGPNSYNVAAESHADDYKRGAFLDKADRFSKENDDQVLGPDVENKKKTIRPTTNDSKRMASQRLEDRYAILQRKVEDLERVHNDGKKTVSLVRYQPMDSELTHQQHQAEVERLKTELTRCQKNNSEYTDRADKQKKQIDSLETRIQDLKKTTASDQAELKDLRLKLRMSEHERTQLASKQGEAGEAKKSLQASEAKLRDKDRRILDLEKTLANETKRKEAAEAKLQEATSHGHQELQAARTAAQTLQDAAATSEAQAKQAQTALALLRQATSDREQDLFIQLEQHKNLVAHIAEEYGRLARGTVSLASHTRLRHENAALNLQVSRLERRLANSVAQVDELAVLIRQTNEQKSFLSQRLKDMDHELAFYQGVLSDSRLPPLFEGSDNAVHELLQTIQQEHAEYQQECRVLETTIVELLSQFNRTAIEQLLVEYALTNSQLKCEQRISEQYSASLASSQASHEAISAQLERFQGEKSVLEGELKAATDLIESFKSSSESLHRRTAEAEEKLAEAAFQHEAALKKDHETVLRLSDTVQKMRIAEDALRVEIKQLTAELADSAKFQEAYYALSDEVGSLVARNQLAEEEAAKLSKFNAEIIGHNNPAQRIMYVDRIRRELAETKQKLVLLQREQENVIAANDDLKVELDMYKSVMVDTDYKPRTTMTRITRAPLVNLTRSLNASAADIGVASSKTDGFSHKMTAQRNNVLESIPGDMTLDEIM
ncbi:hypothetical protein H0H92_014651 [Tricholoma furcatifolium]|nr:hypothetical protein H0H92_014651 [Tricholoma furcatifolium]